MFCRRVSVETLTGDGSRRRRRPTQIAADNTGLELLKGGLERSTALGQQQTPSLQADRPPDCVRRVQCTGVVKHFDSVNCASGLKDETRLVGLAFSDWWNDQPVARLAAAPPSRLHFLHEAASTSPVFLVNHIPWLWIDMHN